MTNKLEMIRNFLTGSILFPMFLMGAYANDWPQWLGPDRNGISTEKNWNQDWPDEGLKTVWQKNLGIGFSAASVQGPHLFTMGYRDGEDVVYCFEKETGTLVWKFSYPCTVHDKNDVGGPAATPGICDGRVFTLSRDGDAYCFDAETGKVEWFRNLHEEFKTKMSLFGYTASPAFCGKLVVFDVGAVVAVDKWTGKPVWNTPDYGATYSSPQNLKIGEQDYILAFNATGLIILDASTGEEFSRKPWGTPQYDTNTATPIVDSTRVFISSGYDRGCALLEIRDREEPAILWEDPSVRTYYNTCILWKGYLYGFDGTLLKCWDSSSGKVQWSKEITSKGCLVIVDGKLLILTEKGELIVAEATAEEYREISRSHNIGGKCWTLPVLSDGLIFVRNAKGTLVCLDAR